jgi:hypothetical protein
MLCKWRLLLWKKDTTSSSRIYLGKAKRRPLQGGEGEKSFDGRRL